MFTGFRSLTRVSVSLMLSFIVSLTSLASQAEESQPKLILRVDDIGMTHATNVGLRELAEKGIPFAASVMFTTPWYQEGVEILKDNPHISVGIHLTLNAEWRHYRWGPIAGRYEVPSIINEIGYFYPSTKEFLESGYKLDEVRTELEAQIQRALATGLNIAYVDYHMRTALATPELKAVVEELAKKYKLRMSMMMGEATTTMFDVPIEDKKATFINHIKNNLKEDQVNLVIIHAARAHPEMQVLVDLNNPAMNTQDMEPLVAMHREAELGMLLSPEVNKLFKQQDIQFINYHDLENPFADK